MFGTSLVDSPPDLFNAPDVSTFHTLLFTVMHAPLSRRSTHKMFFLPVGVRWIQHANFLLATLRNQMAGVREIVRP